MELFCAVAEIFYNELEVDFKSAKLHSIANVRH